MSVASDIRESSAIAHEYLGAYAGGGSSSEALTFPVPPGEGMRRMSFGNKYQTSVRNQISNWRTFVSVYCKDAKLTEQYHSVVVRVVSDMLNINPPLGESVGVAALCQMFAKILAGRLDTGLDITYTVYEPMSLAVRSVFMIWKNHIETLLVKYNKTLPKPNDLSEMIPVWKQLDEKYEIHSSSILILFALNPDSPHAVVSSSHVKKWTPEAPKFVWGTDKKSAALVKALESFRYLGFCPRRPIFRLRELMKFPIRELAECVPQNTVRYDKLLKKINKIIAESSVPKLPKLPQPFQPGKFAGKPNTYDHLIWLAAEYLRACEYYMDYMMKKEARYIRIAELYNKIGHTMKRELSPGS